MAKQYRIWAYRKAAWTVDELPYSIVQLYHDSGVSGLRELPGIGKSLAGEISWWLQKNNGNNKREEL
jgi:DNA polymerase/3'-5' exonuclease PolX